ncbi:aspartate dehydrogenase [Hoeflea prorocentri]|uniref:L-aspartate dehydrogenase n=1 Tax=Hoeflea prorocentri TaxID=1922333 RepID=A0A9X3UEB8_9HYPH|nr:aspartate dehydrogenase [Hoeflea prorocentri]MCY6379757.1 aspartate dehydrogenase [Hoeflea prorocentri]MDA5397557.1 aspartate dehydrogenase [Hoeflea prorocentri]
MSLGHVAIIGYGAIAQDLVGILSGAGEGAPTCISLLVRQERVSQTHEAVRSLYASASVLQITSDVDDILGAAPDVVAECAGHEAVGKLAPAVLAGGVDLVVSSVGALADEAVMFEIQSAARGSGAQCLVPAGAIGGIDALAAARLSGLQSVSYTGRKPPSAWAGTPAETLIDLSALTEESVFFAGSARDAAQSYPKNANVAATVALAGTGMDETQVRLIADPSINENVHEITVASDASDFSMRFVAKPSKRNPKTSRSTVYSIARAVLNRGAALVI